MAVEAVVTVVVDKLANLLIQEAILLGSVKDKFNRIQRELRQMNCYLKGADERQQEDENVKNWLMDIRDLAFDAEDVIEAYILKKTLRKRKGLMKRYAFVFKNMIICHKIGIEIRRIERNVLELSDRRSRYNIEDVLGKSERSNASIKRLYERRRISSHLDEQSIIGFQKDISILKIRLLGQPVRRCIISIIGMGGLGKSTIASKLYNCEVIKNHFACRAWVFVSQVFDIKVILQDIASEVMHLKKEDSQWMDVAELKRKIYIFLKDRRYLVVMDDVWTYDVWECLQDALPDMNNGSRIVFTSRRKEVALHADPVSPHELQPLSDADSWALFSKKVLVAYENSSGEGYSFPKDFEELGRKIVKRCGGLPLAIVVLGGLLSSKLDKFSTWSKMLERIYWQLNQDQTPCSPILALSYSDLPFYLKPCFLHLGLFPEDYSISARILSKMWVAEGFVIQNGKVLAEDIAHEYLEELADRCMVQVSKRRPTGGIQKVRIHDLLRDLSISKGHEVKFLHVRAGKDSSSSLSHCAPTNARRLSFHPTVDNVILDPPYQHVRSAFYFCPLNQNNLDGIFTNSVIYGMLRVLDLSYLSDLDVDSYPILPEAVGKLIHLRCLRLKNIQVKNFTLSIGKLHNLQTLDLKWSYCTNALYESDAISEMCQLRHLRLGTFFPLDPPKENGSSSHSMIRNLQTLEGLLIDEKSRVKGGWDRYTSIKKLKLVGALDSHEAVVSTWISELDSIETLCLILPLSKEKFNNPIERFNIFSRNHINLYKLELYGVTIEKLPEPSDFPCNFSRFSLRRSKVAEDPLPTLGKVTSLVSLEIARTSFSGKEMVSPIGGFPKLQVLRLKFLLDLEELKVEEGSFLSLKLLQIMACTNLKMIPDGLQYVTSFERLALVGMPRGFISRVSEGGEDWQKVAHIPSITL